MSGWLLTVFLFFFPLGKAWIDGLTGGDVELVVDFYNQINLLYGSITEFCSPQSCPEMKATDE